MAVFPKISNKVEISILSHELWHWTGCTYFCLMIGGFFYPIELPGCYHLLMNLLRKSMQVQDPLHRAICATSTDLSFFTPSDF
jgi:hypothetical protein